jgi:hypothetical protein
LSIRRAPRPLCVYYVQGARQARKKVNKRRCRSKPVFVSTPPLVSVAQSCVRHHSQYHHRHPHVQVCHVALFKLWHRRLWLASWWWVCCFLPPLLGSLLHHASSSRQASSSPCPLWSCPLAREGQPHGRDLCGLACVESEDLTLMASGFFVSFVVRLETDLKHSFALPPTTCMHCCAALLLPPSATITHDHQKGPRDNDDHQASNAFPVLPACCQRKTLLLIAPFPLHQLLTTQARCLGSDEGRKHGFELGHEGCSHGAERGRGFQSR